MVILLFGLSDWVTRWSGYLLDCLDYYTKAPAVLITISYTNTVKTHKNKRKTDIDVDSIFDWYGCWRFCRNILVLKCCIFCTLKILFSGYFQSKLGSNKVHSWTSLEGKTETKFDNIKGYVLSFMTYNKYSKENSHGKSC